MALKMAERVAFRFATQQEEIDFRELTSWLTENASAPKESSVDEALGQLVRGFDFGITKRCAKLGLKRLARIESMMEASDPRRAAVQALAEQVRQLEAGLDKAVEAAGRLR